MNIDNLFSFLSALKINNNREWFNARKDSYVALRDDFVQFSQNLIEQIGKFDASVNGLLPKDCIFRIYRDTRFSYDKTPYKTHFGVFIAAKGGRKSEHGGYYLHLAPEGSFLSAGVWMPNPKLLKLLKMSIFENIDEWNQTISNAQFKQVFNDGWYEEGMLKTVPREFPKDSEIAYFLKLKHFLVSKNFSEKELQSPDFMNIAIETAKAGYPLNRFLNFTVDEAGF
ncbi:MAG: DUF2461 domain-containing protein [Prevotellaceae bacterium]|jgi:uncharacterized protein (TIGR02453 family)|nr:DUF2461 domain-containing protein [Prevotellaceae bacterium]